MSLFTKENIVQLENLKTNLNLTILVPTYRANNDEQNRIGLKNAVKKAEQELEKNGQSEEEIKELLKPLNALFEKEHFWDHQSDTLAIFLNSNLFEYYMLPISVDKITYVGNDFYLKPLLNLLEGHGVAHIMTVSPNSVRLLSITDYKVMEHDISAEFPQNIEESKWHMDNEASLQSHGSGKSMYHGHGGGKDDKEEDIKRFFRDVYTGLENFFKGEKHKVILAGVDNTVRLFKETFHYSNFSAVHISGNHDETHMLDLHAEARAILDAEQEEELSNEISALNDKLHTAQAEQSLDQIIKASSTGKIDTLYIKENVRKWGYYNEETHSIEHSNEKSNGQIDLLNQSAIQTILHGGTVHLISEDLMDENIALAHLRHA